MSKSNQFQSAIERTCTKCGADHPVVYQRFSDDSIHMRMYCTEFKTIVYLPMRLFEPGLDIPTVTTKHKKTKIKVRESELDFGWQILVVVPSDKLLMVKVGKYLGDNELWNSALLALKTYSSRYEEGWWLIHKRLKPQLQSLDKWLAEELK